LLVLAEEHLGEDQTLEPLPPLGRDTKPSHEVVIEDPLLTEVDELNDIPGKSLPIISSLQVVFLKGNRSQSGIAGIRRL
jgi:hypothetical protein